MKLNKRAQSATEFVILIFFMLIVFFIFFFAIQQKITHLTAKQDVLYLKEANHLVTAEVDIARKVSANYEHTFTLDNVNGKFYDIYLSPDGLEVYSSFKDYNYINFLPVTITGYLNYGPINNVNTLYSRDGSLILESGKLFFDANLSGISINVDPELCYYANTTTMGCSAYLSASEISDCSRYYSIC